MEDRLVKTNTGMIEGVFEGECLVFKGIPYAKAPTGALRWRAPQKLKPWAGVFKADHFGNRSAQKTWEPDPEALYYKEFHHDKTSNNLSSEDGLYLNIWVPKKRRVKPMAVAFFIHGGAFMGGCGHELEFRTDAYAKKDVILVTINYRLGMFGFLAHPWLAAEDAAACGNYGILDQAAALMWVRENIANFGGDPENITIFGQSAGCMSVQALLSMPSLKGTYVRAILQSGAGYPSVLGKDISLEEGFERGEYAALAAGVSSLEEFRAMSESELCRVQEMVYAQVGACGGGLAFSPVTNKELLALPGDQLVASGRISDVPMIIGSTKNDMTVTPEEAQKKNSRFRESCKGWALQMEKFNQNPCYVYYFSRDLPGDDAGAFHSSELWYMFGTLRECWRPMTPGDFMLSEKMVTYWTNFMKYGNPNGEGLPMWRPLTKEIPFEMVLDV